MSLSDTIPGKTSRKCWFVSESGANSTAKPKINECRGENTTSEGERSRAGLLVQVSGTISLVTVFGFPQAIW